MTHLTQLRSSSKGGFSLIEVLFSITFLILVGVAMATLNNVASRLTTATELKQTALALNEQTLSYVAIAKRTQIDPSFASLNPNCVSGQTCYVNCPTDLTQNCVLQSDKISVTIGQNKLQFVPSVIIRPTGTNGRYLVNATISWGSGIQQKLSVARIIE